MSAKPSATLSAADDHLPESRIQMVREAGREPEKSTLALSAYERIKDDIFEFRMPPGTRFSEQSLANRLGVSRTPLRFALHVLERDGYLNRFDGHSGWQVKPFDLEYYEDLYDFRVQIELIAVRRICAMASAADLSELTRFWCAPIPGNPIDGQLVAREDEKLHNSLVALAGNREMLRTHIDLTERIRIIRRLDFVTPDRISAAFDEHQAILHALIAREADRAESLVQAHIAASRAEIRRITLHHLSVAARSGSVPVCA